MTVCEQYLRRYAEPEARALGADPISGRWRQVLVIPAYGESPGFLEQMQQWSDTLWIIVLNRPDSETDRHCNDRLRSFALAQPQRQPLCEGRAWLTTWPAGNHLLLLERPGALPNKQGVGLARKIGCDVALALWARGYIGSPWIHCSDADAELPEDYFAAAPDRASSAALVYPFAHRRSADAREAAAMALYEHYLQHYVDGLAAAGSPYAFHTLGSCIAVAAPAYARVRGFPRRAGGEDFYLLNKLAKQGPVSIPGSGPVRLSARLSRRAPFGTGPALRKLLEAPDPEHNALFYHPRCFERLRELIALLERQSLAGLQAPALAQNLRHAPETLQVLEELGIQRFLEHAGRHCADQQAVQRHFHQWFDGFRTLKFIHALTQHWERLTRAELQALTD